MEEMLLLENGPNVRQWVIARRVCRGERKKKEGELPSFLRGRPDIQVDPGLDVYDVMRLKLLPINSAPAFPYHKNPNTGCCHLTTSHQTKCDFCQQANKIVPFYLYLPDLPALRGRWALTTRPRLRNPAPLRALSRHPSGITNPTHLFQPPEEFFLSFHFSAALRVYHLITPGPQYDASRRHSPDLPGPQLCHI